jgi:CRISPR/Cas system-associated protein Cas10 (large subunit of type III CRISPR-Cas system)
MDKVAWDYKFFRDNFYPEKEPERSSVKPCPFCGSKRYKTVNEKRVCNRCGKEFG